jgi:potassium efflux system protein
LAGFVKAAAVWVLYGFVRNLLIFLVFPRTGVEAGARYAMLTVLRYGAWVLIFLMVLGALGMDTSTLAVFAGGATVGLAFGLKDIFSNFFSGLIMLMERPVRVGDTVEVGTVKGKIEAIRMRGTTIRTFEGTDPKHVEEILLQVARSDPRVIGDPEPVVRFNNFGNSSLDFSLRVWTQQVSERWAMVSDLRRAIFEAFREHDIEIPFPQRDLHIRSGLPAAPAAPQPAAIAVPASSRRMPMTRCRPVIVTLPRNRTPRNVPRNAHTTAIRSGRRECSSTQACHAPIHATP